MPRLPRTLRLVLLGGVTLAVIGAIAIALLVASLSAKLPDVQALRTTELQEPMYVYASDGRLMGLFGEMRRYPVDIKDVPERVQRAFLAAEDARFYQHHGVDYKGVARAVWLLATTSDKRVPGGSTITQQVARQYFLDSEYSYARKLREMLLAMKMERELGKDEIFGLYLNKSFFGNRAYGVAAAAEFYYGKTLAELTLDEAATLAGTPKFPSSGNPLDNPTRNRERRDHYILPRMAALGYISAASAGARDSSLGVAFSMDPPRSTRIDTNQSRSQLQHPTWLFGGCVRASPRCVRAAFSTRIAALRCDVHPCSEATGNGARSHSRPSC